MRHVFYIYGDPPLGPLSYKQVLQKLESGEILASQLGKGLGVERWTPLEEILQRPPPPVTEQDSVVPPIPMGAVLVLPPTPPIPPKPGSLLFTARPVVLPNGLPYRPTAPVSLRILAFFIDCIPVLLSFPIFLLIMSQFMPQLPGNTGLVARFENAALSILIYFAFFAVFIVQFHAFYALFTTLQFMVFGNSIGKSLMGLEVIDLNGNRASVTRFFFRSVSLPFSGYLSGLGLLLVFFLPDKRTLHDVITGTKVVRKQSNPNVF